MNMESPLATFGFVTSCTVLSVGKHISFYMYNFCFIRKHTRAIKESDSLKTGK